MRKNLSWLLYTSIVAFSFYWAGNLLLWFPWSISTLLGMTLMLTVAPILWGYGVYGCLIRYPGKNQLKASAQISLVFLFIAVLLDYIFFGLIRGAMVELYHPTTFYGYGFLVILPFLEVFLLRRTKQDKSQPIIFKDFVIMVLFGVICMVAIIMIIQMDIRIH